jgi:hypothetical protein
MESSRLEQGYLCSQAAVGCLLGMTAAEGQLCVSEEAKKEGLLVRGS